MTTVGRALRVLVVEDDRRLLEILTRHLDRMGYAVRGAPGATAALQLLAEGPADVILSDVRMPGMDGRTLMQVVGERHPGTRVILMTAFGSVDDAVEAMRAGAYCYVVKPFKVEAVQSVLRNLARELDLADEIEGLRKVVAGRHGADRLLGNSPRMQEVRRLLREAARVNATVLITGRSGTGKELAARAIHYDGPRAAGPFVAVNCAAVPETLFESAMFGHQRGAFSGAVESREGFLVHASGGTIFLDEVGEIPLSHQAKLLRALQEGEVTPVGSTRALKVDVRVIAATNRELESMVGRGAFREDLFYRLNVLRVDLPPLAERLEDVPALAEALLVEIAEELGTPALGFTEAALDALSRHRWPGNVRELKNAVERAIISARGRRIDVGDLPPAVRAPPGAEALATDARIPTLDELQKDHVERVLALTGWNRSLAARLLGIDRRTLFAKIRRYGLVGPLRTHGAPDDADAEEVDAGEAGEGGEE